MDGRGKLLAAWLAAALVPLSILAVVLFKDDGSGNGERAEARPFRPEPEHASDGFPASLTGANRYPVAHLRGRQELLYDRPGGRPKLRIAAETEWNTPRVLSVVEHRLGWLAVLVSELKNGRVAWIPLDRVTRLKAVTWSLHVDLSKRQLMVRHGGKAVRRFQIGIGRPGHSTPQGRFAVTDRLHVTDPASPYGCCVLALSGHQTRLPPGWPGGDRLAVHATADLSGLGHEVSLGCMRAHPSTARWLIRRIPLGSPVFIHA
jgi:hypothetical protein